MDHSFISSPGSEMDIDGSSYLNGMDIDGPSFTASPVQQAPAPSPPAQQQSQADEPSELRTCSRRKRSFAEMTMGEEAEEEYVSISPPAIRRSFAPFVLWSPDRFMGHISAQRWQLKCLRDQDAKLDDREKALSQPEAQEDRGPILMSTITLAYRAIGLVGSFLFGMLTGSSQVETQQIAIPSGNKRLCVDDVTPLKMTPMTPELHRRSGGRRVRMSAAARKAHERAVREERKSASVKLWWKTIRRESWGGRLTECAQMAPQLVTLSPVLETDEPVTVIEQITLESSRSQALEPSTEVQELVVRQDADVYVPGAFPTSPSTETTSHVEPHETDEKETIAPYSKVEITPASVAQSTPVSPRIALPNEALSNPITPTFSIEDYTKYYAPLDNSYHPSRKRTLREYFRPSGVSKKMPDTDIQHRKELRHTQLLARIKLAQSVPEELKPIRDAIDIQIRERKQYLQTCELLENQREEDDKLAERRHYGELRNGSILRQIETRRWQQRENEKNAKIEALRAKQREEDARHEAAIKEVEEQLAAQKLDHANISQRTRSRSGFQLAGALNNEWAAKVEEIRTSRGRADETVVTTDLKTEISRQNIQRVLADGHRGVAAWLDDAVVNDFISLFVAVKNNDAGWKKGSNKAPPFATLNSAWYKTCRENGAKSISRWAKRQGIEGAKLLSCHKIFLPVNTGAHWTLVVIDPSAKTIEYLDSMNGGGAREIQTARQWLATELKDSYNEADWENGRMQSGSQDNISDCGVFTCYNALACALGIPHEDVTAKKMPNARRQMAAILLNKGFTGVFAI